MGQTPQRSPGYSTTPFSVSRRMVAANSALALERHTIHLMTEADVTELRQAIREHKARTGESLSLTAYVVTCLGRALAEYPSFNAFRKRRRVYLLDDITISVAIERELDGESIPQPVSIHGVDSKSFQDVSAELREVQRVYAEEERPPGGSLMRFLPDRLLRAFARFMAGDPGVAQHVGVIGVSAVGMFAPEATWLVPLSPATVMVSVGSIIRRPAAADGILQERESLCLTLSFDHDLVDGAPAARFAKRFTELLSSMHEHLLFDRPGRS